MHEITFFRQKSKCSRFHLIRRYRSGKTGFSFEAKSIVLLTAGTRSSRVKRFPCSWRSLLLKGRPGQGWLAPGMNLYSRREGSVICKGRIQSGKRTATNSERVATRRSNGRYFQTTVSRKWKSNILLRFANGRRKPPLTLLFVVERFFRGHATLFG